MHLLFTYELKAEEEEQVGIFPSDPNNGRRHRKLLRNFIDRFVNVSNTLENKTKELRQDSKKLGKLLGK